MRVVELIGAFTAGVFCLYLFAVAIPMAFFASMAFVLVGVVSALMAAVVAFAGTLATRLDQPFFYNWQSYIFPLSAFLTYFATLLMALALLVAPFVVFISCVKKNWRVLALASALCAGMQFFTLDQVAAHRKPETRTTEQAQATNLYPFVKAGGLVYLAFAVFASAAMISRWRVGSPPGGNV